MLIIKIGTTQLDNYPDSGEIPAGWARLPDSVVRVYDEATGDLLMMPLNESPYLREYTDAEMLTRAKRLKVAELNLEFQRRVRLEANGFIGSTPDAFDATRAMLLAAREMAEFAVGELRDWINANTAITIPATVGNLSGSEFEDTIRRQPEFDAVMNRLEPRNQARNVINDMTTIEEVESADVVNGPNWPE